MANQELTIELKDAAAGLGFGPLGIAPAVEPTGLGRFHQWLSAGYAGEMRYLENRREAYAHPRHVLAGVRTMLVAAMNYRTVDPPPTQPGQGRVSRYAWGHDYHDLIRERLNSLAELLQARVPGATARGVVDTAPLLERELAQLAGLGWIGKNTLLLNKRGGAGVAGSDRIEITWPNGALKSTWLEVTVRGNDAIGGSNTNTGLETSDVFYFGSAPGDSGAGNSTGFKVDSTDEQSARNNARSINNRAPITDVNDFNRDGVVNSTDQMAARNFATPPLEQLVFLDLGAVVATLAVDSAPSLDLNTFDNDIALALSLATSSAAREPSSPTSTLQGPSALPTPSAAPAPSAVAAAWQLLEAATVDTANLAVDEVRLLGDELLGLIAGH